jgi:HAMP domain-containing protein
MHRFLIDLIGRLTVGRKLILIYALDLSAVIFISTILINEKFIAIDFARKEIVGKDYIAAIRDATLLYPTSDRAAAGADLVLDAEARFGNLRGNLGSNELAQALSEQLRRIDSNVAVENGKVVSLAPATQALITRIGNQSNLILDPDLDSYYTMSLVVLRFPELFDLVSQMRQTARVAGLASGAERAKRQADYLILEGRLDAVAKGIDSDYAEAMAAGTPALRAVLEPPRSTLLASINALRSGARQIAIEREIGPNLPELEHIEHRVLQDLAESWTLVGNELGILLQARIDSLFKRMWLHLGTAAGLLLLILSVVYFVARQIALPIRRLSEVAQSVRRSGDYTLRAEWRSFDEIGRLITAFNEMLEQLDRSRRIEQELAAQARATAAQRDLLEAVPIPLMLTSVPKHDVLHTNSLAQEWLEGRHTDPWLIGLEPQARVRFFQQLADTGAANEFEVLWQGSNRAYPVVSQTH